MINPEDYAIKTIQDKDKRITELEAEKEGQANAAIYWHGNYNNLEEAKDKRIAELEGLLVHAGNIIQSLTSGTLTKVGYDEVYQWAVWLLETLSEGGSDD